MTDSEQLIDVLDARVKRREDRRGFFRNALGAAAVTAAGATALTLGGRAQAQTTTFTDADVLNFALNLEYLEAQFYSYAATGAGLASTLLGGSGQQGAVQGGRKVTFTDPAVAAYAREIAADEVAHVSFLRAQLGASAVAQPAIDVSVGPNSAFSVAARAAGVITAGQTFDPYATDENFLLGAFIFEDVGVSAYKGAAPLLTSKAYLEAAAGILAVEAYHAAIIRTTLTAKGLVTPSLWTAADGISNARDTLDGPSEIDQGITPTTRAVTSGTTTTTYAISNIVPTDNSGIVFSRSPGQVLNIVYLTNTAASLGGFFPAGVNGTIKTAAAA
ncbi:MAG TPA: ferritin-like domain-containing protein [Sphingomonas sp.]|jgi:hypothetical protein|nr:ferritin-like domain-containing protein [Sphingomonas sp.]